MARAAGKRTSKRTRSKDGGTVDVGDEVQVYLRIPKVTRDALWELAKADDRKLATYMKRVLVDHAQQKG